MSVETKFPPTCKRTYVLQGIAGSDVTFVILAKSTNGLIQHGDYFVLLRFCVESISSVEGTRTRRNKNRKRKGVRQASSSPAETINNGTAEPEEGK